MLLSIHVKEKKDDCSHLCTVSVFHSGLHMKVIIADKPKKYLTRISSCKNLQMPTTITGFGE
ncbi:hypothetical protein BDF21DRAFT_338462 [Thamnidium elegans]|nr:hypothetical protein BDF21DRAFT_338462 [Thamnidium elegans]